jgi:hypothetical protein
MRKIVAMILAMLLSLPCWSNAHKSGKPSEKDFRELWAVEFAIDALKIKNPIITKDLVRAIYWHESNWRQYGPDGKAYSCKEKDVRYRSWGIAQIYDDPRSRYPGIDYQRIKTDADYNIQAGLMILEEKFKQARKIRKTYKLKKSVSDLEIGVTLYNGWKNHDRWEYAKNVIAIMHQKPWQEDHQ